MNLFVIIWRLCSKMASIPACVNCGCGFSFLKDRVNKKSVDTKLPRHDETPSQVIKETFGVLLTPGKGALCSECINVLKKINTSRKDLSSYKRKFSANTNLHLSTPSTPSSYRPAKKHCVISTPSKKLHANTVNISNRPVNIKCRAVHYFNRSMYSKGIKMLLKNKAAMKAFLVIMKQMVRKEVNGMISPKKPSVLRLKEPSDIFMKWPVLMQEVSLQCPVLESCLIGACVTKKGEISMTRGVAKKFSVIPNIGAIVSQIAFARNQHMNVFQHIVGMQMWLAGCARETFHRFNKLGLTVSIKAVRSTIDKIRVKYDQEVKEWKAEASTEQDVRRRLFEGLIHI